MNFLGRLTFGNTLYFNMKYPVIRKFLLEFGEKGGPAADEVGKLVCHYACAV